MQLPFSNQELIKKISKTLEENQNIYKETYLNNKEKYGIGFVAIDGLIDDDTCQKIYNSFPQDSPHWREMNSFREKKLTSKAFDKMPQILGEMTFAIQSPEVIKLVEQITVMESLKSDPTLYAGGLSMMRQGDFLNPHIDNSHDQNRENYRRLNLLYYVTPDWSLDDGGHLELWDKSVKKPIVIESKFNRLVLMETHDHSWHSVNKVKNKDHNRCCVSNYYFSDLSPNGKSYYHITSFAGRPEEPMKRVLSSLDNITRTTIRIIKKDGIGKKDQFVQK